MHSLEPAHVLCPAHVVGQLAHVRIQAACERQDGDERAGHGDGHRVAGEHRGQHDARGRGALLDEHADQEQCKERAHRVLDERHPERDAHQQQAVQREQRQQREGLRGVVADRVVQTVVVLSARAGRDYFNNFLFFIKKSTFIFSERK